MRAPLAGSAALFYTEKIGLVNLFPAPPRRIATGVILEASKSVQHFLKAFVLLTGVLASACALPGQAGATHQQRVLILNSYNHGYVWSDSILAGIESVLGSPSGDAFEFLIEYMDLNRFPPPRLDAQLRDLYKVKYADMRPDVAIVSDDGALKFMLQYGDELFPGVPVVFCGINRYTPELLAGRTNYTGVVEAFDMQGTIELALRLHPGTKRVVGVSDELSAEKPNLQSFRAAAKALKGRAEFVELVGMRVPELEEALRNQPPDSVIVNLSFHRDRAGNLLSSDEGGRLVAENSAGPVYSCWDFALGTGILGGRVVSGFMQGAAAAEMALKILRGARPADIPVLTESPNRYMFDYRALRKAGLTLEDLPPDSVVINKPESFYLKYKTQIWLAVSVLALLLLLLLAMGMNILERRKGQRELRIALDELESIFANSQVGIMLMDAGRRIRKANARLAGIMGYADPAAMIGAHFTEFKLEDEDLTALQGVYFERLAKGEQIQTECRAVRRDGEPIWCQISGKAIDSAAPPDLDLGVLWVMDDVTERVKSREVMVQTEKMLSVGGLAAGMAHEINNPLGIILAAVQNLERRLSPEFPKNIEAAASLGLDLEKVASYKALRGIDGLLGNIRHSGERAAKIIRSMLDFSRQSESSRAPHDLADLLEQALELAGNDYDLKKKYDFRSVKIIRDYDLSLPNVRVTETEVVQVFLNLMKNAAQAMAGMKNGNAPALTLRTRRVGGAAQVEIEDNGPGIPEKIRRRIFEPFFTSKPPGEGTGLGLSVAFFLVTQNHGGELLAVSEKGKGAKFIVRFPLDRVA